MKLYSQPFSPVSWVMTMGLLLAATSEGFQTPNTTVGRVAVESSVSGVNAEISTRKGFLAEVGLAFAAVTLVPLPVNAKSYSSNARNMERMNSGDMSGGSIYDNNPTTEAGKKRRAITGCKSSVARAEAAENFLKIGSFSESDCNRMVLGGESEFMLETMRKLECPTCPYGISTSRN